MDKGRGSPIGKKKAQTFGAGRRIFFFYFQAPGGRKEFHHKRGQERRGKEEKVVAARSIPRSTSLPQLLGNTRTGRDRQLARSKA